MDGFARDLRAFAAAVEAPFAQSHPRAFEALKKAVKQMSALPASVETPEEYFAYHRWWAGVDVGAVRAALEAIETIIQGASAYSSTRQLNEIRELAESVRRGVEAPPHPPPPGRVSEAQARRLHEEYRAPAALAGYGVLLDEAKFAVLGRAREALPAELFVRGGAHTGIYYNPRAFANLPKEGEGVSEEAVAAPHIVRGEYVEERERTADPNAVQLLVKYNRLVGEEVAGRVRVQPYEVLAPPAVSVNWTATARVYAAYIRDALRGGKARTPADVGKLLMRLPFPRTAALFENREEYLAQLSELGGINRALQKEIAREFVVTEEDFAKNVGMLAEVLGGRFDRAVAAAAARVREEAG